MELLFASLANKKILNGKIKIPVYFPFDYLNIIEKMMYNEDSTRKIEFSRVMDIKKYYDKQSEWELNLGNEINKYLAPRRVNYNFQYNYFSLEISQEEIEQTFKKYPEEILEIMDHFTKLLTSSSYERRCLLLQRESARWQQEKMRELEDLEFAISLERRVKKEQEKK